MSLINIYSDEIGWGEIIPGVYLVQAGETPGDSYKGDNGIEMSEGRFGLTISNDPCIVFSTPPVIDILEGVQKPINYEKWNREFFSIAEAWEKELIGSIYDIGYIYTACIKAGWEQKRDGNIGLWLSNRVAKYLREKKYPDHVYFTLSKDSKMKNLKQAEALEKYKIK